MLKARIIDIKKFAVHDGRGLRTTIFFKGCPLKCIWCHNPEGLLAKVQTAYFKDKCVNCGSCAGLCRANHMEDGVHIFSRELCTSCLRCEDACPMECFRTYGREYTAAELMDIIMEDKAFYDASGGGVTLSGGECLLQAGFCAELLELCRKSGINTAVDTCGYVDKSALERVAPYTDTFLYDIKAIDEDVHIRCTGRSNKLILDNLKYLDSIGKSCEIRYPFVPGYNSDQAEKITDFLCKLKNISDIKLLPFHNLSNSKYRALGFEAGVPDIPIPTSDEISLIQSVFDQYKKDMNIKPAGGEAHA